LASSCFIHLPASTAIYTLSLHDALPISGATAVTWPLYRPTVVWSADAGPPRRGGILRARGADPVHFDPHLTRSFTTNTALSFVRSEEHTSELQSLTNIVCRLLLEKKTPPRSPSVTPVGRHFPKYLASAPGAKAPSEPGHAPVSFAVGLSIAAILVKEVLHVFFFFP